MVPLSWNLIVALMPIRRRVRLAVLGGFSFPVRTDSQNLANKLSRVLST